MKNSPFILFLFLSVWACSTDSDPAPEEPDVAITDPEIPGARQDAVYLDTNGITVKAYDWARVGIRAKSTARCTPWWAKPSCGS